MQPRRASAALTLPPVVAVLAIFLAGGLGAGALARGFVDSLHPPLATATARATATNKSAAVTVTAAPPTAIPTQAGPDQPFLLAITATPSHVSAGTAITITVVATTKSGGKLMAGLSCVLAAPRSGPTGLLSAWPTAQTTDARGMTSWTITVPSVPAGTYGVEVSAAGPNHYSFWSFAVIYVG